MKSEEGEQYEIKQVSYVDDYVLDFEKLANKSDKIPFDVLQDEFFFKKTSRWKDELEYRLVRPLIDCPKYKHKPKTNYSHRDDDIYLF
jgi:hypothetical protein